MVPAKTLYVSKVKKAQFEAPTPLCIGLGQPHQPVRNLRVLITQLALIPVATLADVERSASQRHADSLRLNSPYGHLPAQRGPRCFFPRASFSSSFCIAISAYIFLSHRFSSAMAFAHHSNRWRLALTLGHQASIHAAIFASPIVISRIANAMFAAQIRHRHSILPLLQNSKDLRIAKSRFLHISLQFNKTLEKSNYQPVGFSGRLPICLGKAEKL